MQAVYLVTIIHAAAHACFTGSKVLLSLLALDLGASQLLIGALVACYSIAPLTLGVYSGRLADTIGMRVPMLIGVAAIACAMLIGSIWQALPALFTVAMLVGVGFVFFVVSVQNLVGAMPGNRTRNYSILTIGYSASNFVGPLTAGFAIDYAGYGAAFLVFALFTLLPIAVLTARPDLTLVDRASTPAARRGAAELLAIPALRRQIVITGLLMAAWELYVFYVPIYGRTLGLSASTIGVVLSAFAVATFLVRFVMSAMTSRVAPEHLLAAAMLLGAFICAVFPLLTHAPALIAASFLLGVGLGCGQPLSLTLSYERSPPGRTGEVTGLRTIATNVARFIVPLVSGVFGSTAGAGAVFWMNAVNLSVISYLARRSA
jgi:MFS family permease